MTSQVSQSTLTTQAVRATESNFTDNERRTLIELVKENLIIWDSTHKDHSKRNLVTQAYVKIADDMTLLKEGTRTYDGKFLCSNCFYLLF